MVKKLIISVLALIICLMGYHSFSQEFKKETKPDQYRAVNWTTDDGLSSNYSNLMIKDIKGFLWVGSSIGELCRFDGAIFKTYFPDQNKRGTINSDAITSFQEDSLHNIWIGTGKGLSRYDIKADTFTNIVPVTDPGNSNIPIFPFWSTSSQVYCLEAGFGIVSYDIYSLKRKPLVVLAGPEKVFPKYAILDTVSNQVWMQEMNSQVSEKGGILQISLDGGRAKHYTWPCYRKSTNHTHGSEAIQYDRKRNSIWINGGDGLFEFTLADKQFHHVNALNDLLKLEDYDRDAGMEIDRQGKILVSTKPKGIFIYDPETKVVRPLLSDSDLQQKVGNSILHIYCDRDGIIWTSHWQSFGIYELLPFNPPVKRYAGNSNRKNSLSNGQISTIVPGPGGKMWIGTADGLNIFDPVTETFEVLREKDLPGIKGTAIIPLHIDTIQQKAWINAGSQATFQQYFGMQMYEMDLKSRKCRPILFRDGSKPIDTFSIAHTLVRPYRNGLFVYDDYHGLFEIKEGSLFADLLIPYNGGVGALLLEEDRYMFFQAEGKLPNFTFKNINGKWTKIPHPLDSLFWLYMLSNKRDQSYWVSFKNQLVHYDKDFQKIKTYSKEDGYNGLIYKMQIDNAGNLWFVNILKQIGRLNSVTGIITTLSEADGYQKQNYGLFAPLTKDARGNMYVGIGFHTGKPESDWGLDRIYPERYASAATSSVYLNSLNINQKPFPLSIGVNNIENLSLGHNQSTLSIETGIIDYYSKGKGHIRYKLEQNGKGEDWQYGPAYSTIRYESLPPGTYRLVLQSSITNNEFNGPEKILKIYISPAFWNTWWFRIIAVLFVLGIFYMVVRYRTQQKFRMQLERSETERQMAEMRQKTAELQQQKTEVEMQALRAQMNPHFIFNSLNSINRFILQNNRLQASEYLTKFSKLVRMILQNSQASLITLESELEALGLYLEMEALRFNYHFDYKISVPKDLDIEVLKVPPLIIQPYVENAIWHGLMHKEEKGQLDVEVSQEDEWLYFKVTDNGIGRKRASELASKSATKHKSMGLRITAHRIAMMQNSNGSESPVTINDLVTPDGTGAGTEVVIKMPVIYN